MKVKTMHKHAMHLQQPLRGRRGFTLVEVMIAILIVAVLAAIAYPSYLEHVRRSRRVEAIGTLMELMQRQERHFSLQNSYFAFSRDENPARHKWYSAAAPELSSHEIRARACNGEALQACVELQAIPGTAAVDPGFADPGCGTLVLSSRGTRSPDVPACWR